MKSLKIDPTPITFQVDPIHLIMDGNRHAVQLSKNSGFIYESGAFPGAVDAPSLHDEIKPFQHQIKYGGKLVNQPRLTAWMAPVPYPYSGTVLLPQPWTKTVLEVKKKVDRVFNTSFDSVLVNYYRNGGDYVSPHSDAEAIFEMGQPIVGVSFGAPRTFRIRSKQGARVADVELANGSLIAMTGKFQAEFVHEIPKRSVSLPRISLTFRKLKI